MHCTNRPSSDLGVIAPWVRTPKNVAVGYDVGKISAGCLVFVMDICCIIFCLFDTENHGSKTDVGITLTIVYSCCCCYCWLQDDDDDCDYKAFCKPVRRFTIK